MKAARQINVGGVVKKVYAAEGYDKGIANKVTGVALDTEIRAHNTHATVASLCYVSYESRTVALYDLKDNSANCHLYIGQAVDPPLALGLSATPIGPSLYKKDADLKHYHLVQCKASGPQHHVAVER
jgi:hypothetical protein